MDTVLIDSSVVIGVLRNHSNAIALAELMKKIFDPSLFVTLRKRLGAEGFEAMNQAILDLAEGRARTKGKPAPHGPDMGEVQDPPPPPIKAN